MLNKTFVDIVLIDIRYILWRMKKKKYDMKETLDIAESIVTIIMFVMAVWGTVVSVEQGFWHKLYHVVNHYHHEIDHFEKTNHELAKVEHKLDNL